MVIHEMTRDECIRVLADASLVRLGCARENQPYVVPVYLTYDVLPGGEPCLYGFTTLGQKIDWMRDNPLVCVEMDEVTAQDHWVSVIAFGRYEELFDPAGNNHGGLPAHNVGQMGRYTSLDGLTNADQRVVAHHVLDAQAMWWEPACTAGAARSKRDPAEPIAPLYYRIRVERITGHRATPDPETHNLPAAPKRKEGWLSRVLRLLKRRPPSH